MSSPEQPAEETPQGDDVGQAVPPTAPAYSTPPPEGVPSADDQDASG
ncbi:MULTISPECIES: hypothetical protein [unclassified Mycobacterium]|nr:MULTISPECIES: hypothetical protein [unclassified Mycobacterium]